MTSEEERRKQHRHRHKQRVARGISDELWADFETAVRQKDSDRSAEIRRYIEWYVHRPGAELPERPEPPSHR
ncbi:hypothetical protein [Streptomyces sp. DASNCL29]|uniref:hypothetical protein n=1 Tax=Streptomyces sp. DASNCL29 TaxID=2583819 RepID=UPI00110FE6F7|nr:hypothetical protein [Streptomyces sp. DASNCL29]TMU98085.1 hypothetical protein FGK60_09660 [Streptomyces sp. DASNCL29]